MKKETINTFDGGMIRDLHPLTTPNNVLTDALNATLITYNGNENILQNDIGNVKIKDALLQSGYVPVGMKEHGGIIYVAAYNPETKKGQIGSFPSPQQLWENENWTVNTPPTYDVDTSFPSGFYNGYFIQIETIKKEIFTNQNGEARKFHPGDRFVIKFPVSSLAQYVNDGYVSVQLGIVKSDGSIEIMRTWSKESPNTFLYDDNGVLTDIVKGSGAQVFDASSSGQLILIVNLHTLDSFNLIRTYSLQGQDTVKVTFTGEGFKDGEVFKSTTIGGYMKLSDGSISEQSTIEITGQSGTATKMIYPNVPFGIVQRMGRQVNINFSKIKTDQDSFGEWRFFVTPTYVKIGWSYDFYNLDGNKQIEYIRMYFHPLENGYDSNHGADVKRVDFQREYYNGNFEDYINYKDIGLVYRRVYIVEIAKKLVGGYESPITFKMLYLSPLYNEYYNGFYVNNAIGISNGGVSAPNAEFSVVQVPALSIKLNSEGNVTLSDSKTRVMQPGDEGLGQEISTGDVKANSYIKEVTKSQYEQLVQEQDSKKKQFLTQVKNTYSASFKLKGELEGLEEKYIGIPRLDLFKKLIGSYTIDEITIEGQKEWKASTENINFPDIITEGENNQDPVCEVDDQYTVNNTDTEEFTADNISLYDCRLIQGLMSDIQSSQYESKGLKPLYSPDYSPSKKSQIAPYWNQEQSCLCMSGAGDGDNESIHYNSTLVRGGYVTEGPDAGGGCDDGGLFTASHLMGDPMTNIFAGDHGEDGELTFNYLRENTHVLQTTGNTPPSPNEMDFISSDIDNGGNEICHQNDNYLIACWKFADGDTRFVNLATPRIPWNNRTSKENFLKNATRWPRLDVMLRCILSQIFVVNKVNRTVNYITSDEKFYRYQEGTTKIKIKLVQDDTTNISDAIQDIMVSEVAGKQGKTLQQYFVENWSQQVTDYGLVNLIPQIEATLPDISEPIEIEVPNYYDLNIILGYYLGVTYKQYDAGENDLDIQAIYGIDIDNNTEFNAQACESSLNGRPKAQLNGAYKWISNPKLTKITDTLKIYRWDYGENNSEIVTFPYFGSTFTTRAKINEWADIPENEDNEVLAKIQDSSFITPGNWTDGGNDEHAPDMHFRVLFSPEISALNDSLYNN